MNKIIKESISMNYLNKWCAQLLLKNVHKQKRWVHISRNRCQPVILDGRKISAQIESEIKSEVDEWIQKGNRRPKLIALLVGDDYASNIYINKKMKAAQSVGIESETIKLNCCISEQTLIEILHKLNLDPTVDGILVQLPLPEHINKLKVSNSVIPCKDVDGFNFVNSGKMFLDMENSLKPCTAMGVIELIKRSGIETFGKNAVVCGRSKTSGLPIALLLQADSTKTPWGLDATVTICNRHTHPLTLACHTLTADIIIAATGTPGLIKQEIVKPGACIIDVGITRVKKNDGKTKLVGDVDFEGVSKVAGFITPVPGGIGPLTVSMLMRNTLTAAKLCSKNAT